MPTGSNIRPFAGFVLALSLLGYVGLNQYDTILALTDADASVETAHSVIGRLEGVDTELRAAESFGRGFVATGDESFVTQLNAAAERALRILREIAPLVSDNPPQAAELRNLTQLAETRLAAVRNLVDLRRNRGLVAAASALRADGADLFGRSRGRMFAAQEQLLVHRRDQSRQMRNRAVRVSAATTLVAAAILLWAALLLRNDLRLRRDAEIRLAAERDFSKAIVENLQDAVIACTADGTLIHCNPAAERILNLSSPLPGNLKDFAASFRLCHPGQDTPMPREERPLARALRGETVTASELVVTSDVDFPRTTIANARPMRDASGVIFGAVLTLHDVTESRQAARLIREKDELYSSVISAMAEGVVVHDSKGRIVAFNDAALRILGVSSRQLLGILPSDFPNATIRPDGSPFPPSEHPANVTLRTGKPQSNVVVGVLVGPACTWLLINSVPLTRTPGAPLEAISTFADITELRHAEQAIRRSEKDLHDAQHLAGIGSWTRDAATGHVTWSEELYRLLRRDPALPPVWIEPCPGIFPPDSHAALGPATSRLLASGEPFELDLELQDGSWVCSRGEADFDSSGRIVGWRGTVQDITDRKRAERQLKAYADELHDLYNNAPCGYHSLDADGLFVRINDTELAMLGYSRDELVGKMRLTDVMPESELPKFRRLFNNFRTMGPGARQETEYVFLRKDGTRLNVYLTATSILDEDGAFRRSRATVLDISARKAAERRYRHFVEHNPAAVLRSTPDGQVLDCNNSLTRMLGYDSPEEIIRQPVANLYRNPAERAFVVESLMRQGALVDHEIGVRRKDGSPGIVALTIFATSDDSSGTVFDAFAIDITRRKEAEAALALNSRIADIFLTASPAAIFPGVLEAIRDATACIRATISYTDRHGASRTLTIGDQPPPESSLISVPILSQDDPIGLLEIACEASPGLDSGRRFLETTARYLAPIMSAHLFRGREELERRRAENALRASLTEKEVLLREIHHRVRNNLQIMTSLLRMQGNLCENARARELFRESENRIASMAAIHESLYDTTDLGRVDFLRYLRRVVDQIAACYRRPGVVCLVLGDEGMTLPIRAAMPCGLIVNELVSNALKHGFDGPSAAPPPHTVEVAIRRTGKTFTLTVEDNGKGIPEGFDLSARRGLGLTLVDSLARQLHGAFTLGRGPGARFRIEFETSV